MDEKENYFIERQQRLNSNILTYQKDLNKANDKIETYIQNERAKNFKINEQE